MTQRGEKAEKYFEVSVTVPRERQDGVCDYIIQNFSGGVVVEDEEDAADITLKFYVPENRGEGFKKELAGFLNEPGGMKYHPENIKSRLIEDIEWVEAYKRSIQPVEIGIMTVRPPWAKAPSGGKIDIVIEPKMAFGTGSHETTRLCLTEISRHFKSGQTMFDLGCGSGILSVLAAKLGASAVTGVDIDMMAVANAKENIEINGVRQVVRIEFGSIEKAWELQPFDFVAANLIKSTILDLYDGIRKAAKSGGIILLSGLLTQDRHDVERMLERHGDSKYTVNQDGQWLAYTVFMK